jgi:hypothetical protein
VSERLPYICEACKKEVKGRVLPRGWSVITVQGGPTLDFCPAHPIYGVSHAKGSDRIHSWEVTDGTLKHD